jgi:hypothetical protein
MADTSLSDECKQKIKELEEKLTWSIKLAKDSNFPHTIYPDIISFLSFSCRYISEKMDETCKKVMLGYEDEILNLNIQRPSLRLAGLEKILGEVKISKE